MESGRKQILNNEGPTGIRKREVEYFAVLLLVLLSASVLAATNANPTAKIETPYFRFTLTTDGRAEILDKSAGVTWAPRETEARLGIVKFNYHEQIKMVPLTRCGIQSVANELLVSFRPLPLDPSAELHVIARALPDQRTLELSCQEDDEILTENVSLLDDVLGVTDAEHGYVVVPVREGLLVPADSGLSFTHRFDTSAYEGCHMQMLGVVQNGAAALLTWEDPYVAVDLRSELLPSATNNVTAAHRSQAHQRLSSSFVLSSTARVIRIQFLGKGDYVTIAKAYRRVAHNRGLLVTWDQKLKIDPERAKLFGAANIKLWSALDRRMNETSTKEESVRLNWTFDEAAQVAEHYKQDLRLDKVLFTVGGWIHRGYDNQHPDILPAAPECGGDPALADCSERVRKLGYLFCLHDNYQDIYRDSPSWDEHLIMKTDEQKLAMGGRWAGGRAYLTCSQMALGLAQRPQNLPAVKKLTSANSYFIDTTYAAGLQECYDLAHRLTRADDMKWKQALSDYARGLFGVFGSECGREWAIPHADFFEGLTGVSGHYYHDAKLPDELGATVVPLFDMVYRDCIAMYGKYGYDPRQAADYVLYHISLGRPLNYHNIPAHLYWKQPGKEPATRNDGEDLFTRGDHGWTEGQHPLDRFIKNTYEVLSPLNEITARMQMTGHHFLSDDHKVQRTSFGQGADAVEVTVNASKNNYVCTSRLGGKIVLPTFGFVVESPTFVAFHASNWNGLTYSNAPLFTLRSLDGRPLTRSRQVRIYHGFGDEQIRVGRTLHKVVREEPEGGSSGP